jgi:hypothetical protein
MAATSFDVAATVAATGDCALAASALVFVAVRIVTGRRASLGGGRGTQRQQGRKSYDRNPMHDHLPFVSRVFLASGGKRSIARKVCHAHVRVTEVEPSDGPAPSRLAREAVTLTGATNQT